VPPGSLRAILLASVPIPTTDSAAPRVTVLIGSYDNAATLPRAIDSILAQSLTDLELIVVDDGSTDATAELTERYARDDARVRLLSIGRNVGISSSLNEGLRAARAPIVAINDADDFSAPRRLERQLALLDARPEVAVVGCRMHEVDEGGHALRARTSFRAGDVGGLLMHFNPIPNTSAAMRRDAALAVGGYDAGLRYAMEYDLWLRLAERWTVWVLDEPLATRVMSGSNVASRAERAQIGEAIALRLRAMRRRRSLRGVHGLVPYAVSYATPLPLKRALRRRLGQAP
jgi:glycosyltransferase involved in cell wall biosynthesis